MDKRSADIACKLRRAHSRRTGKLVRDSHEKLTIKAQVFPGFTMTFDMVANPQADRDRVSRLALYHITAFHYFTTYRKETRLGEGIPGEFAVAGNCSRSDWGNGRARYFANVTKAWDARFVLTGKEVFIQAIIRRRLPDLLWSWAIEWNRSLRVFGFYGDQKLVEDALAQLPILNLKSIAQGLNCQVRMREEVALSEADDILFEHEIGLAA
jgi:hypothetical protein